MSKYLFQRKKGDLCRRRKGKFAVSQLCNFRSVAFQKSLDSNPYRPQPALPVDRDGRSCCPVAPVGPQVSQPCSKPWFKVYIPSQIALFEIHFKRGFVLQHLCAANTGLKSCICSTCWDLCTLVSLYIISDLMSFFFFLLFRMWR